jgi:tRNA_anti-like
MKPYIKIVLFVVLFIAVSAILAALIMYNKKHTDTSKAKPDFIITSTALQKEFQDNETMASTKYIKKVIEVSGTITSVTSSETKNLNISLKTGNDESSVICTLATINDPSMFKTGNEITIRGECSGFTQLFQGEPPLDVLLNNCSAVPTRK